ncbi:phosphate ABC transporter ATP-binding protein [bacterium]|nr:phosphate ABC transporter ATP-binding protein [bacterium]
MVEKLGFKSVSFAWLDVDEKELKGGKRAILRNISFSIGPREVFIIAGPSGSGKSTVLRLANRLLIPTGGTVFLDSLDTLELDVTQLRRRVGLVQQTPALFEGTVLDNIMFGPRLNRDETGAMSYEEEKRQVVECLGMAGLSGDFIERKTAELSEGEKQRVAIARVLANQPEVLLMDEPTASLDPSATLAIEKHVRHLTFEHGLSVLFVTHDVDQAKRIGDRGLLLVDGQKVDEGPLPKLFDSPSNDQTKAFVNGNL